MTNGRATPRQRNVSGEVGFSIDLTERRYLFFDSYGK